MPATRTTNLTARADALRVGDIVNVLGIEAELAYPAFLAHRGTTVYLHFRIDGHLISVIDVPVAHMVPVVRFAAAGDAEFEGL